MGVCMCEYVCRGVVFMRVCLGCVCVSVRICECVCESVSMWGESVIVWMDVFVYV